MKRGVRRTKTKRSSATGEQLLLLTKRGGKRRGAGRPAKGTRAGSPHRKRAFHDAQYPVHVVLRVASAVGNLRRRSAYHAIRKATRTTARREDFRIVHLRIQRDHVHLLVEANDKVALATGMQGPSSSRASSHAAMSTGEARITAVRRHGKHLL